MVMLLILFETFLNALFLDTSAAAGCGPSDLDEMATAVTNKAIDVVMAALIAGPFMALIAYLLTIDEK